MRSYDVSQKPKCQDHYCTPVFNMDDFIKNGTMTDEMYRFLSGCFTSGLSTCFTGNCGSGKTTAMGSFLKPLSDIKKILIIEKDFRDLNMGSNNVVHWIANEQYSVKDLLSYAVAEKPDALCLGEMMRDETLSVMEICQTGQFMTTIVHANSCRGMYERMASLCMLSKSDSFEDLYKFCVSCFPIGVHIRKMDDGVHRVTQISESYIDSDGEPVVNLLYKYEISLYESFGEKIVGDFVRVNEPSDGLKKRLRASAAEV